MEQHAISAAGTLAGYQPFSVEDAIRYARAHPPVCHAVAEGATLDAREVGDGNLNLIFIVSSTGGPSAVIKQALPYVRLVGESWPLTIERNRYEREAYAIQAAHVPDLVPIVYHGDHQQALFIMEDLSRLELVRRGLIAMRHFPRLAGDVARFSAETLLHTTDFYLSSAEKKQLVARFINPQLCKITEDLVLTDPFLDAPSNAYEPELQPAVTALWNDTRTRQNIELLRYAFVTRAEALLHGDLHTGSVMGSAQETKVVDPEFCFFGPLGFDIGMFIANLFLSAISHLAHDRSTERKDYVMGLWTAAEETWRIFAERADTLLRQAPVWQLSDGAREEFLQRTQRDAMGFAGAEMIRRTIGLARVADFEGIAELAVRLRAKTAALEAGRQLINNHAYADSFGQAISLVQQVCTDDLR